MENISGNVDCSCPFHSLTAFATLSCILFYGLTKNEFLCLVTKYQKSHFLSSHNYGLQTSVFIWYFGYSSSHCLLPWTCCPVAVHYKAVWRAILSFYYLHKHSPITWTWKRVIGTVYWIFLAPFEKQYCLLLSCNRGWWKSSQSRVHCREQCHISWPREIWHGPNWDDSVAQCYVYLPLSWKIEKLACLGFLLCFWPCVTRSVQ